MEFPNEREPPTGFARGGDDGDKVAASPPSTEPSAQGGGAMGSSTQGGTEMFGSSDHGAVVPPRGSEVGGGDQRKGGEEERGEESANGGGEVAANPLNDLNIQWTTSMSGLGDRRDANAFNSGKQAVEVGPSGSEDGGAVTGEVGGEKVAFTHLVEPSAQPVMVEEGRDVAVPLEKVVVVEVAGSSEEERETTTGGKKREGLRGEGASGNGSGVGGEDGGSGGSGDNLKGKRVTTEESVREQGPVGISLGEYAIHADPVVVVVLARKAPRVLDAEREEVIEQREAEMAALRQVELEVEAEAEEWIREAKEEEAELELRVWEELEVAQGPCVSVVEEADVALAERPRFDEATYDPLVHLFIPSGIDAYVSQQEMYFGEIVLLDPERHLS